MEFYNKVYDYVKLIPLGKVTTYGEIARAIGNPRASRAVGYALHRNPMPGVIPCHRVVNRNGELSRSFAFGGLSAQKNLLINEGVIVNKNKVDLSRYMFYFW